MIKVDPASAEILRTLQEKAEKQGKTLDVLLRPLIQENGAQTTPEPTLDEFMQAMESLAEEDIKPLPRNFSREDIYYPRD